MTKDGIEYNMDITPYIFTQKYERFDLTFKFSSELYMNKFMLKVQANRKVKPFKMLYPAHNIKLDVKIIDDVVAYERIEKRGFQVIKRENKTFYNENDKKFHSLKEMKITSYYEIV